MRTILQPRVAVLLPYREHYAQSGAGAVSTVVDGFARHSGFRATLKVLGAPVADPLQGAAFQPVDLGSWWRGSKSHRYLTNVAQLVGNDVDLVEIHNRPKYVLSLRKKMPRMALALYLHNDPRTMEGTTAAEERRTIAANVQAVICVSDYIRRCFLEGLEDVAAKVFVQPNAVDTKVLCPAPESERRQEIIFVGRTIADKGPHLLVEAAEKVLPAFLGWKMVIVGGRYFGSGKVEAYEQNLFQRVARLGVQGEVTGYVPRQEAIARMQRAAIAVLPSLWEDPMPMAPMEAAACGCAVITTRRGGIPEGLGDAALYLAKETSGAVESLLRKLMNDPAALRDGQKKARAHVVNKGDIRQAAQRLDELRAGIMNRSESGSDCQP